MFIFSRFPNRNIYTFQYGLFKVIAIFLEWPVLILVEWEANPALMELGLSASLYHLPQSFGWRAWDNSPADPYNRYNMIACLWGLWSRLINLNVFVFSICIAFILSHDWASLFLTFYHGNSNICKKGTMDPVYPSIGHLQHFQCSPLISFISHPVVIIITPLSYSLTMD